MANYNIVAKNVNVPTSSGTKTYYNMVLIDEDTGQIKSAVNTTSQAESETFISEAKKEDPNLKINGKSNVDPFSDGTFEKQKNYDVEPTDKPENTNSNFDNT